MKKADGTYEAILRAAPDRGYNVQGTTNYASRHQNFGLKLNPYYGAEQGGAVGSLQVTYEGALRYVDPNSSSGLTTGLDPTAIRPALGFFPPLPVAKGLITIDQEGMAYLADGSFFISDEYGPFIYYLSAAGDLLAAIEPPQAILPLDANGQKFFTSAEDPVTGRVANQGREGTCTCANMLIWASHRLRGSHRLSRQSLSLCHVAICYRAGQYNSSHSRAHVD